MATGVLKMFKADRGFGLSRRRTVATTFSSTFQRPKEAAYNFSKECGSASTWGRIGRRASRARKTCACSKRVPGI
jgi:hypothetical protein